MATFFLLMIYAAFISLGLPDSLLGVAWPLMYPEFGAPLGFAGFISIMISSCTIISSLFSSRVIRRFGTGKVTSVSVLMTALGLLGISLSPSVYWLLLFAVPLGLGAGAVDCGLNEYMAEHYHSMQMSWLHCFWGVGAMTGPVIMSRFIDNHASWRNGYLTVSIIQLVLAALLFATLPLWKKMNQQKAVETPEENTSADLDEPESTSVFALLQKRGVLLAILSFTFYCGVETTMGLWGSSFLVKGKAIDAATAAAWVSSFYGGITVGRFLNGFVTLKFSNPKLIRTGQGILLLGIFLLLLPLPRTACLFGFLLFGLGCAPIFPCMLHETPARFGKTIAQRIMGMQMAGAYFGSTILPPIFGWVASHSSSALLPVFLITYAAVMIFCTEKINLSFKKKDEAASKAS